MSLYLDASILVALFVIDPANARAAAILSANLAPIVISDFGAAEFSSAVARRVRTRDLSRADGQLAFLHFDMWITRAAQRQEITTNDIGSAERILRRLDLNLRTPDAVHIAIARRLDARLATLDRGMEAVARALGMSVVSA